MGCAEDAQSPTGSDCMMVSDRAQICLSDAVDVPLYASWYSHELCDEKPINCDGNAEWKAGRRADVADYGSAAACPHDWLFRTITTPYGSYLCDDRGGAIRLGYREIWTPQDGHYMAWAWTVDFFLDPHEELPWWVYLPIGEWSID